MTKSSQNKMDEVSELCPLFWVELDRIRASVPRPKRKRSCRRLKELRRHQHRPCCWCSGQLSTFWSTGVAMQAIEYHFFLADHESPR